jgi:uncharacterized heparinase superfamily protein
MPDKSELERITETGVGNPGPAHRFHRALQIARYYRWTQMARRGKKLLIDRILGARLIGNLPEPENFKLQVVPAFRQVADLVIESNRNHIHHSRSRISEGHVVLLGEPAELGQPINFKHESLRESSHLWRFQLEYHEFLLSLSPLSSQATETVARTLTSWLNQNPCQSTSRSDDSWHPYCISRRIPVWIWLLATHPFDRAFSARLSSSLYQQAYYLHDNLEYELGGNHLLENLTALSLAAALFGNLPDAQKWSATVEKILRRELAKQITAEGEHYERAPMYHCQVLGNLLIVAYCTQERFPRLSQMCREHASVMYAFIRQLLHPDGEIPLFGDSGFGESPGMPLIDALAGLCEIEPQVTAIVNGSAVGNYWVSRAEVNNHLETLIFDVGPVGADELPAHAHCDLLNIEASIGGNRWIVDSGNFNYNDDTMRWYCRSSVAHNVVTVDRQNQCDIWSRFRMGYRGQVIRFRQGGDTEFAWASAVHDGYRRTGVPEISRLISVHHQTRSWLCADYAAATNQKKLVGYLHLAPEIQIREIEPSAAGPRFKMVRGTNERMVTFFNAESVRVVTGWYCPAFGIRKQSQVFEYSANDDDSAIGWMLYPGEAEPKLDCNGKTLCLLAGNSKLVFDWTLR